MVAAALVLTALPLLAADAGAPTGDDLRACATPGQVAIRPDTWARIKSPQYAATEGERKVTAFAVPATQRGWVYVTNGSVVQLSTSAGCKWDHVYPAPSQTDAVAAAPRPRVVTQLVAPAAHTLWVTSYDDAGGAAHPHVERSLDATPAPGNRTVKGFESFDSGLPAVGRPVQLALSAVNADEAYLVVDTTPDVANGTTAPRRQAFRSAVDLTLQDTKLPNKTWTELALPAELADPGGIAVSPADSSVVWAWAGSAYAVSTDRGDHWTTRRAAAPVTAIDVDGTGRAAVFTKDGEAGRVTFLDDTLTMTGTRPVPVVAALAAHARRYDVHAVAGADGTYGWDVNHERWVPIHPRGVAAFERMAFGTSESGILLGQAGGDLYRFDLFAGDSFLDPPPARGGVDVSVNRAGSIVQPTIRVQHHDVTVAPTETVPDGVDFGMPPSPVPLDVFFLMDTTDSMGTAIAGLKKGVKQIARNLTERTNGSACFGVGDVKDESIVHSSGSTTIAPYRLVQPITCDLDELQRGVDQLTEGGGNPDEREAQTIALTQAVTGKGQTGPPAVLPEQDAHFTAPTRVIVLITDAGFMQGTVSGQTFPTIKDTVQTLNAYHDTKVVGIVVHTDNDFAKAQADVTALVQGTHTVAPSWGVDCDGIGGPDVAPGEPLVCATQNEAPAIEPAIVALLLNVKDPATMASRVDDPHHVVSRIDGRLSRIVDLKRENHQPYTLHLTCSPEQDGQDLPVRLYGAVRADTVIADEVVVHCRAPRVAAPRPRRPRPLVQDPPRPSPPRPRIAPIVVVEPPPGPNLPNNMNLNGGLSQEEQKQFQIATVSQDATESAVEEAEEPELAMTGLPRSEDRAAAALLLGAATFVSAGATAVWATRRRTQLRGATARF